MLPLVTPITDPAIVRDVAGLTGCICDTVTPCPIIAGTPRIASYILSLGGENVRWVDAFSPLGKAVTRTINHSEN